MKCIFGATLHRKYVTKIMASSNTKALLVGINPVETQLINSYVGGSDFLDTTVSVDSYQEAVKFLTAAESKIIIINPMLVDADGRDLIHHIRAEMDLKTPILVISSIPGDKYYIDCISLDAQGYLSTPLQTEYLKNEINRILFLNENLESIRKSQKINQVNEAHSFDNLLKDARILVAEDDYFTQQLVKEILTHKGAHVDTTNNGEEALRALKPNYYACVLLDIQMPAMDGFQNLQIIRGNPQYWNLPVIIISSLGQEEDILKGYQLGANEYLLKPFNQNVLVARIKSLLV